MPPAARSIAQLLAASASASSATTRRCTRPTRVWTRWHVAPLGPARAASSASDVLCVQLDYFSRYHGLLGDRFLPLLQAEPGAGQHGALGACSTSTALADGAEERPHRRGLARQPRARRARPEPAAARHRHAAGDAARRRDDARVAPAQRLGRGAPDRRAARARRRRRRPTSGRRSQARSLISKPIRCRREVGDALLLLIDHGRPARGDEALVGELGRSPWRSRRRGARSPSSGERSRRRGRSRRAARAASSPATATGESLRVACANAARRRTS